jgi:hypothetical protein
MAQIRDKEDNMQLRSTIQPLAEDTDTPLSPSTDPVDGANDNVDVSTQVNPLESTHQVTDGASDLDSTKLYDEGPSGAAEASESNAGNTVIGYNPRHDVHTKGHDVTKRDTN